MAEFLHVRRLAERPNHVKDRLAFVQRPQEGRALSGNLEDDGDGPGGGVGVRETIAFMLYSSAGIAESSVVSYTLLATATGFMGALPGGIAFSLSVGGRKRP